MGADMERVEHAMKVRQRAGYIETDAREVAMGCTIIGLGCVTNGSTGGGEGVYGHHTHVLYLGDPYMVKLLHAVYT